MFDTLTIWFIFLQTQIIVWLLEDYPCDTLT
jgi:hypothetical protein